MDIDKKGIFQGFPEAVSFEKKIQSIFRRNPGKTKTIGLGDISINNTSLQKNQQELEVFSKVIIKLDV